MVEKIIAKKDIIEILTELCVPANNKGYRYLLYAIELSIADNRMLNNITTELYPNIANIAEIFGDTAVRVERAIRHAIEVSYHRTCTDTSIKYFGKLNKKTTNSEFIATLVLRLQFIE